MAFGHPLTYGIIDAVRLEHARMTGTPLLPLIPEHIPAQRLVEVVDLPPLPRGFDPIVCMYCVPKEILPTRRPRNMVYLGTLEWAWGPLFNRVESYWLHRARRHWVLWLQDRDWNNGRECEWQVAAYVRRAGLSAKQVAPHLILARFRTEREERSLDHFHFVSQEGALRVRDWMAVGRQVWSDEAME